jgi:hypothetical protein
VSRISAALVRRRCSVLPFDPRMRFRTQSTAARKSSWRPPSVRIRSCRSVCLSLALPLQQYVVGNCIYYATAIDPLLLGPCARDARQFHARESLRRRTHRLCPTCTLDR